MPTTVADLKALTWTFKAHADGSDPKRGGRFSVNMYEAEFEGETIHGEKTQWRGGGSVAYGFRGQTFATLAELVVFINSPAGDVPEARDD